MRTGNLPPHCSARSLLSAYKPGSTLLLLKHFTNNQQLLPQAHAWLFQYVQLPGRLKTACKIKCRVEWLHHSIRQRLHLLCHIWCSYDSLPGLVCELILSDALPAATVASAGSRTACQRSSTPPAHLHHRHTNKKFITAYDSGTHDTHATNLLAATQVASHKYHITFLAAAQISLLGGTLRTVLAK